MNASLELLHATAHATNPVSAPNVYPPQFSQPHPTCLRRTTPILLGNPLYINIISLVTMPARVNIAVSDASLPISTHSFLTLMSLSYGCRKAYVPA